MSAELTLTARVQILRKHAEQLRSELWRVERSFQQGEANRQQFDRAEQRYESARVEYVNARDLLLTEKPTSQKVTS